MEKQKRDNGPTYKVGKFLKFEKAKRSIIFIPLLEDKVFFLKVVIIV